MLSRELDYSLPPHLIAQSPAEPRHEARLLRVQRDPFGLQEGRVRDLPDWLRPDDLLVFNDTRVLRARLKGRRATGGRVEALLLREIERNEWEALLKPSARLAVGQPLTFEAMDGTASVVARPRERTAAGWLLRFELLDGDVRDLLPVLGEVPLPPYIHPQGPVEEASYQTAYARPSSAPNEGHALDSAAAPTAGLHFSPWLLDRLRERGVQTAFVTLGVGIGTFRPVQAETLEEHVMHREEWEIPARTSQLIAQQKQRGGRVVAVGTTTVRVLESAANESGLVAAGFGATELFIRPGYRFRVVDALMTNFHLPRSTLLAMIAAFMGDGEAAPTPISQPLSPLNRLRYAYSRAIESEFRFFSWGDAMFIE